MLVKTASTSEADRVEGLNELDLLDFALWWDSHHNTLYLKQTLLKPFRFIPLNGMHHACTMLVKTASTSEADRVEGLNELDLLDFALWWDSHHNTLYLKQTLLKPFRFIPLNGTHHACTMLAPCLRQLFLHQRQIVLKDWLNLTCWTLPYDETHITTPFTWSKPCWNHLGSSLWMARTMLAPCLRHACGNCFYTRGRSCWRIGWTWLAELCPMMRLTSQHPLPEANLAETI